MIDSSTVAHDDDDHHHQPHHHDHQRITLVCVWCVVCLRACVLARVHAVVARLALDGAGTRVVPTAVIGQEEQAYPAYCVDCLAGQFANTSNSTNCTDCPPGRFAGTSRASVCEVVTVADCAKGFALVRAPNATVDGVCEACVAGFFQPTTGSTASACSACVNGTYASDGGASVCVNHSVSACPAGSALSALSAVEDRRCDECSPGRFQPSNASAAPTCTDWTWQDEYECSAGFNISLNLGTVFTAGSATADSECDYCPAGTEAVVTFHTLDVPLPFTIACVECPPGRCVREFFECVSVCVRAGGKGMSVVVSGWQLFVCCSRTSCR